ncbi:MAG: type II toxin-antitoxin system RelE/ParE family toxin [Thermodesulfobacteriota bacterium]|nr:type II toxin-antitoxin system RelE/ParE family toxin [Thermodesulfobacteriota bacterium]
MTDIKEIIQSPIFAKQKKKLHENRLKDLNNAVKMIFENPDIGDMKGGDLKGIRIYKFKFINNQILLAYEVDFNTLYLYAFGSHEHFYRDLKKYIH